MFGQIWAEFSSWDVISQVLVTLALLMGVLSALTAIPMAHARKMVDEMQGLVKTAKRQKRNAVAEVHTAYIEAMKTLNTAYIEAMKTLNTDIPTTPAPPLEDWCPKCDKVHVRKLMKWNDEGQLVCIYCASPAIKTPPPELGPLAQQAMAVAFNQDKIAPELAHGPGYDGQVHRTYAEWQPWGSEEKAG